MSKRDVVIGGILGRGWVRAAGLALLTVAAGAPAARAEEAEGVVQTHGFGTIVYGRTNHNRYSVGSPGGDYDHGEMALVTIARPTERLTVATNLALEQSHDGIEADLDYAFAEWSFSDALRLRAGRVKQPFGLYTEIFDVGTLRPFVTLPQGLYGPAGFVAEGFDGLGLTGRLARHGRWALAYDAYFGSIPFGEAEARAEGSVDGHEADGGERVRDTFGLRLNVETPVSGLLFGVSAYTGKEDEGRHRAAGLHLEYLARGWSLRTELAHRTEDAGQDATTMYVELARQLGKWQVAVRHERADTAEDHAGPDSLDRHRDTALGLNYWFSPDFALKAAYHRVSGNRFAVPDDEEDAEDGLRERTDMFVVGAQFSF